MLIMLVVPRVFGQQKDMIEAFPLVFSASPSKHHGFFPLFFQHVEFEMFKTMQRFAGCQFRQLNISF